MYPTKWIYIILLNDWYFKGKSFIGENFTQGKFPSFAKKKSSL